MEQPFDAETTSAKRFWLSQTFREAAAKTSGTLVRLRQVTADAPEGATPPGGWPQIGSISALLIPLVAPK
jgi:hypothetical protein